MQWRWASCMALLYSVHGPSICFLLTCTWMSSCAGHCQQVSSAVCHLGHTQIDLATVPDQWRLTGLLLGFIPGFIPYSRCQMTGTRPGFVPETLMTHLRARMSHSQPEQQVPPIHAVSRTFRSHPPVWRAALTLSVDRDVEGRVWLACCVFDFNKLKSPAYEARCYCTWSCCAPLLE